MEIRQTSAALPAQQLPPKPVASTVDPDEVQPPPKGGLPASQQMLSKLTPTDRAAIAGATGFHLSPTGAITNATGAMPPWSYILAFAASRTADPVHASTSAASDAAETHAVDTTT